MGHPGDGAPGPVRVALLGSTGSIGRQTLDVLLSAGPGSFRVMAMAAGRDVDTFASQLHAARPLVAALADPAPEVRVDAALAIWSIVHDADLAIEHAE